MVDFPTTTFVGRETENLAGLTYDPTNKKNLYSEDIQNIFGEINAIEAYLRSIYSNLNDLFGYDGSPDGTIHIPAGLNGLQVDNVSGISFYTNEINVKSGVLYFGYRDTDGVVITPVTGKCSIGKGLGDSLLSIGTLPTSASGLSTGDVWNDGGTLKIV